jgi:hypothetical protein
MPARNNELIASLLAPDERIVKPRNRTYARLPVVAIHGDAILTENGEIGSLDVLVRRLSRRAPTLFVKINAADFVGQLDEKFGKQYPTMWQWRATAHERSLIAPNGNPAATRIDTVVHFFGFRDHKTSHYHRIIDPIVMYGQDFKDIWPSGEPDIVRLLQWGIQIRDFCDDNGIEVRPTTGSVGIQFLTDKRFYPEARRKVPHATNEAIRERLPGNHYSLIPYPSPEREYTAYYLDQHRAHHYHARTSDLPDANFLYAYGRFTDLAEPVFDRVWDNFFGLYCLDLHVPSNRLGNSWVRAWLRHKYGVKHLTKQFVYTNELRHLLDCGYEVTGVRAAWGSHFKDTGLARYAKWAEEQLDTFDNAKWLKPLLLATYGTLATRPRQFDSVFKQAKGDTVTIRTGHHKLTGKHVQGGAKLEPRIANVLHRGMIEAGCRSDSIGLAQYLETKNHRVLSIYADAVIVEVDDDKELPILPEPWRLKQTLNHLRFINQQAFVSGEMDKLPGVGRELITQYRQHAKPGYAPRVKTFDILTHRDVVTGKRVIL